MSKYTFFVDESCHLEHDASPIMCVGAIKVPDESIVKYKEDIKAIKRKYGLNEQIEFIGFVLSLKTRLINALLASNIWKTMARFVITSGIEGSNILSSSNTFHQDTPSLRAFVSKRKIILIIKKSI